MVTHPFHPRKGEMCHVIRVNNVLGKTTLRCVDDAGSQFLIAASSTDYERDGSHAAKENTSTDLDYQNLLELREIVDRLMSV
jgi:hypothetical protein